MTGISPTMSAQLSIRWLGQQNYADCWQAMQVFTRERQATTIDEIWFVEHPPVFTQGQSGKPEHLLNPGIIPVVQTDRGGQITYHGPGQLMIYLLLDIKRKSMSIRTLVSALEQAIIDLACEFSVQAYARLKAPGVYVLVNHIEKKLASIGLRVRRGCTYHGIALNVNMDLSPFGDINPCGFSGLQMTQFADISALHDTQAASHHLIPYLTKNLGYTGTNQIGP